MNRLTVEVIMRAPAFKNTLGEKELDLRGNKIPRIENLGATQDQFDVIDLSNNQIESLGDFPILKRCTTLLVNNNLVNHFGNNFYETLPNLHTLILTNNQISSFSALDPLTRCPNLLRLSLVLNPIQTQENYRLVLIRMFPSIRFLDFQKVKKSEREESMNLFK